MITARTLAAPPPPAPANSSAVRPVRDSEPDRAGSQTLPLWRWTTSSWVSLDSRSVGTTEVQVDKTPTGTLADYVSGASGDGEVRARVRCTRTSSPFYKRGGLMQIAYERP